MSFMGQVVAFFPLVHALSILTAFALGLTWPVFFLTLPLAIWILPLAAFRFQQNIRPLKEGLSTFSDPIYSPWFGSYQFQQLFLVLPSLERILHVVPGLYSAWLRGWGSKVGKGVFWTPHTLILDRSLLTIGDRVIFGHRCSFSCHVISTRKNGKLALFVKGIEIGSGTFMGAGCDVGPGSKIDAGSRVPEATQFYPNQKFPPPPA